MLNEIEEGEIMMEITEIINEYIKCKNENCICHFGRRK